MKTITLQQNTPEWLSYRRNRIGASDASSIMGIGFMTPNQLFYNKLGLYDPFISKAMNKGQELEPMARDCFIRDIGVNVEPVVVEHEERPWQMASLDGISKDRKLFVEIKTGGETVLNMAKEGKIPEKYFCQIQHQLEVTGLEKCFYYFFDGERGYPIEIKRDDDYIQRLVEAEKKFWDGLQNFEAPPLTDKDRVTRETAEMKKLAAEWLEITERIKTYTAREKEVRELMLKECEYQNSIGGGVTLTKVVRQGNVDYKAIAQLKDMDLNPYRKEPTEFWRVAKV